MRIAFAAAALALACCAPTVDSEGNTLANAPTSDASAKSTSETKPRRTSDSKPPATTPAAPASCQKNADCNSATRVCQNGSCVKASAGGDGGAPAPPAPTPECIDDIECLLGAICTSGTCVSGCRTTFDCPIGESCAAGQCVVDPTTPAVECTSDGACNPGNDGSGKICSASGTCVPGCHQDNQCPGIQVCGVDGFCH